MRFQSKTGSIVAIGAFLAACTDEVGTTGSGSGAGQATGTMSSGSMETSAATFSGGNSSSSGTPCVNLECKQVDCAAMGSPTTTVSGTIYDPAGVTPLYNVVVYVPNAPTEPFVDGPSCDSCANALSGSPLVTTLTDTAGKFTLENVPVGQDIPLVIQIGKWRRQLTLPAVNQCVDNPLTDKDVTRLPRNQAEGDIPQMAIATGNVDGLECVLRKIGVADEEFTKPDGTGRIHIFTGMGAAGQNAGNGTPNEGQLWGADATLAKYDLVLLPCQGGEFYGSRANDNEWPNLWGRMQNYTAIGGRIFATHYSYVWMHGNGNTGPGPWESVANWNTDQGITENQDGVIDQSFPKGVAFAEWLLNVMASPTLGVMPVKIVRRDADSVGAQAQQWMSATDPSGIPLHFTFNTPVTAAPADQCGRVVFSDFHVANASNNGSTFPDQCNDDPTTPQEKLVEFMLFDLSSCIIPDDEKPCPPGQDHCGEAGDPMCAGSCVEGCCKPVPM